MAIVKCRECKNDVSDKAKTCPHCGVKLKESQVIIYVICAPIIIILLMLAVGSCEHNPSEKDRARAAISECWKQHERKSLDYSEKLFIAGACEKMEADFTAKYGVSP